MKTILLVLTICGITFATPITGQLTTTGDGAVSATALNLLCDLAQITSCLGGTGQFTVTGPSAQSGSFLKLANTMGTIMDISQATAPVNEPFLLQNFMTFAANPDIVMDLTFIHLGTGGACPSATTCTPEIPALVSAANPLGLSPFNLTNTPSGTSASFSVTGDVRNLLTGEVTPFNGVFSSSIAGEDVAQVLNSLAKGAIVASYSGQFVATAEAPIPETMTILMIGAGLVVFGFRRLVSGF